MYTTRFFVDVAQNPEWITWLNKHNYFNALFNNIDTLDKREQLLAQWLTKHFLNKTELAEIILFLITNEKEHLNPFFWACIANQLVKNNIFERLVTILLTKIKIPNDNDPVLKFDVLPDLLEKIAHRCADYNVTRFLPKIFLITSKIHSKTAQEKLKIIWEKITESLLVNNKNLIIVESLLHLLDETYFQHNQPSQFSNDEILKKAIEDTLNYLDKHQPILSKQWREIFSQSNVKLLQEAAEPNKNSEDSSTSICSSKIKILYLMTSIFPITKDELLQKSPKEQAKYLFDMYNNEKNFKEGSISYNSVFKKVTIPESDLTLIKHIIIKSPTSDLVFELAILLINKFFWNSTHSILWSDLLDMLELKKVELSDENWDTLLSNISNNIKNICNTINTSEKKDEIDEINESFMYIYHLFRFFIKIKRKSSTDLLTKANNIILSLLNNLSIQEEIGYYTDLDMTKIAELIKLSLELTSSSTETKKLIEIITNDTKQKGIIGSYIIGKSRYDWIKNNHKEGKKFNFFVYKILNNLSKGRTPSKGTARTIFFNILKQKDFNKEIDLLRNDILNDFSKCTIDLLTSGRKEHFLKVIKIFFQHASLNNRATFYYRLDEKQILDTWDIWLHNHWQDRLEGVPVPLEKEIEIMLQWLPYLGKIFPQASSLAIESLTENQITDLNPCSLLNLLKNLCKTTLISDYPNETAKLIICLCQCASYSLPNIDPLNNIVKKLQNIENSLKNELNEVLLKCGSKYQLPCK